MKRKRFSLFLTLAALGLAGCNHNSASPARPKEVAIPVGEIGSRLPDFSVKDLQGREISSADLRGKVVLSRFLGHVVPTVQERDAGLSGAA
jgi:cytochrome oxidase Cu insertion factor (SCO1/SenC/PrrC family)